MLRYVLAALLLCSVLAAQKQEPRDKSQSFAGIFQDGRMKIDLRKPRGDRYEGTVFFSGRTYPLSGRAERGTLKGAFTDEGRSFPFTAAFEGERLRFTTGGAGYLLEREVPVNPLAAPPEAAPQAAADHAKVHRHASGAAFAVPEGWAVRDMPQAAALLPPADSGAEKAEELYVISTHAGFTGPDDPKLVEQLRSDLAGTGLRFDRAGERDVYTVNGRAITALTWELRNPETGVPMIIRLYMNESAGHVQTLAAIAGRERVLGWDAQLREIAAGMYYEPAPSGPADVPKTGIAESWTGRLAGTTVTQTVSGGGLAGTKVLTFRTDGTFDYSASASFPSSPEGASANRQTVSGRWRVIARDGRALLELTLANGTQSLLPLSLEGDQILLDGERAHVAALR